EGVSGEAPKRLHLVLDHGRDLCRLHPFEMKRRKAQYPVDQLEADAPQHALAEPALIGVDVELEEAVEDDQPEEDQAQRHQHLQAVELKPLEYLHMAYEWEIIGDMHEGLRGAFALESLALDRAVDDLLRQIEGQEIGDHRDGHHRQNPELLETG